ncbi:PilW family protein [Legionella sainthelensi]|uniref:Prepilin cleavage protein n=1 Tax=Legionella sainthelensi TaxID=28087 RepID=A0A2H5FLV2_9GAMM|nr:prepilin cleavage protein [Legionella sainthelensi]AUH72531.1 prepilin cleavage protein [Legionella sainthelensi]
MKKQEGMSLSEVLISLFLATVIITMLIQFYLESKHQYLEIEKVLEAGFDVQWVDDLLSDSIRRAGFTPCLGLDQLKVIDHRNYKNNIQALNVGNQPIQFIQVRRMKENFAKLIKVESPTTLLVQHVSSLNEKRPLLIADCNHAEIHELIGIKQQVNETRIILKKPLIHFYETSAYVGEFLEERWFVKKNVKRQNALYYHWVQTEEVTSLVHSLSMEKQFNQNKQFLEVTLGLENDKTHKIIVAVRGS